MIIRRRPWNRLCLSRQNAEDVSHDAAEENGEPLYEPEPQTQYAQQEDQDQDQDLYQTPAETTAGGEALLSCVTD